MKRKWTIAAAALLIFCLMAAPVSAKAKTYKDMSVKAKTLSQKTIKLKWKKLKVDKYTIYRVTYDKDGNEKEKKLKTISGKKTSVVIKAGKNQYLSLHIVGVKKSKKIQYDGWADCWTGLATPEWDEYCYAESPCSPSSITLEFYRVGGQKTAGFQIYRKAKGDKKFKKIKTIKTKKKTVVWKDKSVKAGKTYIYKVRSYRKSGKKKTYSKKSEALTRYAVNFNGKYTISSEENGDQITIRLTSNSKNGDTVIREGALAYESFLTDTPGERYKIRTYSLDGKNWTGMKTDTEEESVEDIVEEDEENTITLPAGGSLWLRAEKEVFTVDDEDDDYYEDTTPYLMELYLQYRGVPCILDIPVFGTQAKSYLDSDSIH